MIMKLFTSKKWATVLVSGLCLVTIGMTAGAATAAPVTAGSCAQGSALGAVYTDAEVTVPTCGPRPNYASAALPQIYAYPGALTTYGYQCVEFVERYLYWKYGVTMPVGTNGDQVVDHYVSRYPALFKKIANGTANAAPQQGDVLSLSRVVGFNGSDGGHTAVVMSSTVDGLGNGTIRVAEENSAANGTSTGTVSNWVVSLEGFPYIKWLHATRTYAFKVLGQATYAPDGATKTDLGHAWIGETAFVDVTVQNTGTATWGTGPGISMATYQTPNQLYDPGWVNADRPAILPAGRTVAPGASYTFRFPITVGMTNLASFVDRFDVVAEGVGYMPDAGIGVTVSFVKTIDRAVATRHNGPGGYTMAPDGTIAAFGGAPAMASNKIWQGWDIARGMVLRSDDLGGYILDGWGGLHPFGNAPALATTVYWSGWDIARGIVLRSDDLGGYVLDGWGGVHPFGNAPDIGDQSSHYWKGWDIARSLVLTNDNGGWVMDGWGGLHPFGNAPALGDQSSHYWYGWDIARAAVSVNGGTGGYVLDGQGGIHAFGTARALTGPRWNFDVAKSMAVIPTGDSGTIVDASGATHPLTLV